MEVPATEPSLAYVDGDLRTVAGKPGSQLDVAAVVNALNELDGDGLDGTPVRITAPLVPVPPQQSDDSAVTLLATVRITSTNRSTCASVRTPGRSTRPRWHRTCRPS
ncbi:MAG: hypothetical protein R2755_09840 [Acidimicrobiales bacterium]